MSNIKINHNSQIFVPPKKPTSNVANNIAAEATSSFHNVFAEVTKVNFSKHANMRMVARDINLSQEQLARIENGITTAKQKGINDSLVLMDDVALVVNVPSGTVITALDNKLEQNVFTNIDGAVIV